MKDSAADCQPCARPSSNSSLDYRRGDARIAENGFATSSSSVSKSAKVVLDSCSQIGALVAGGVQLRPQRVL
jgi:hypothetical protein